MKPQFASGVRVYESEDARPPLDEGEAFVFCSTCERTWVGTPDQARAAFAQHASGMCGTDSNRALTHFYGHVVSGEIQ